MQYIRSCTLLIMFLFMPFGLQAAEDSNKSEPVPHQLLEDATVRAKPSKSAKQVGTLEKDSTVQVHAISNKGWATVMHNGKKGYIEAALLKEKTALADSGKMQPKDVVAYLVGFPIIMWPFLLPYMIYRNVVKRYKPVTIEQMIARSSHPETIKKRSEFGVTSDEDLDEKGAQFILDAYNSWTPLPDSDEKTITDVKQIKETVKQLKKVQSLCPTNPEMLTTLNSIGDALNQAEKRFFNGSYTHLTINTLFYAGFVALLFWASGPQIITMIPLVVIGFLGLPISYWLSARMPEWKSDGKISSRSGAFLKSLAESSGNSTTTTTRYSDGSSTVRTQNTGLQAFGVGLVITVMISTVILPYLILINFWKNYVKG